MATIETKHEAILPRKIGSEDVLRGHGKVRWAVVLSSGYVVSFHTAISAHVCRATDLGASDATCTRHEGHLGPHVAVEYPTGSDDDGLWGHILAIWR